MADGGRRPAAALTAFAVGLALLAMPGTATSQPGCAGSAATEGDGSWRTADTGIAAPGLVAIDHADPDVVAVADVQRVAVTVDGGCTWTTTVELPERSGDGSPVPDLRRITDLDVDGGQVAVAIAEGAQLNGALAPNQTSVTPQATTVLHSTAPADAAAYRTVLGPGAPSTSPDAALALAGLPTATALQDGRIAVSVLTSLADAEVLVGQPAEDTWQRWTTVAAVDPGGLVPDRLPPITDLAWDADVDGRLYAAGQSGLLAVGPGTAAEVGPGVGVLTQVQTTPGRVLVTERRPLLHRSADAATTWTELPGPDPGRAASAIAASADTVAALLPGARTSRVELQQDGGPWEEITPPEAPRVTAAALAVGDGRTDLWVTGEDGVRHLRLTAAVPPPPGQAPAPLEELELDIELVPPVPPRPATLGLRPAALQLDPGETASVTLQVDLPPRPGPVDVAFVADETGSMGAFLKPLRDEFASIVAEFSRRHVDARYGVGVYEFYDGYVYDRRVDISPPGPALAAGLRGLDARSEGDGQDVGGANIPTAMVEGLYQAATGEGYAGAAAQVPPDQDFTFRPGTERLLLHATDMSHDPAGGGATLQSAIASLQAAGIVQAGVFVANEFANPTGYAELVVIAQQTGALAATPVDCDGDGQPDVGAGEPLVCGEPEATAPRGQEIPDGQLPTAIADLALAAPELRDLAVTADDTAVGVAIPDIPQVDVRRTTTTKVAIAITCPTVPVAATVRLTAALPAEVLGTSALPVTCGSPPLPPDEPPPADPPVDVPPPGPAPAPDAVVPAPGQAPPAAVQVPATAPAPASAPSTATGTAPAAGIAPSTSGAQAGATAATPAGQAGGAQAGSQAANQAGNGQLAAAAQRRQQEAIQVRTAEATTRRLPFSTATSRPERTQPAVPVTAVGLTLLSAMGAAHRRRGVQLDRLLSVEVGRTATSSRTRPPR